MARAVVGRGSFIRNLMIVARPIGVRPFSVASWSKTKCSRQAWATVLNGTTWTAPVLSRGRLYARNSAGKLVCVDLRQAGAEGR